MYEKSNFLCVGHVYNTSRADIVEGDITRSSIMLYFWESLACGLKVNIWTKPLEVVESSSEGLVSQFVMVLKEEKELKWKFE